MQLSALPILNLGRLTPNLILAAVVWLVFYAGSTWVIAAALLGGLSLDLYSGNFFGLQTCALLLAAWSVEFSVTRIFSKQGSLYLIATALALGQLVYQAVFYLGQLTLEYFKDTPVTEIGLFFSWYFLGQIGLTIVGAYAVDYLGVKIFKLRQQ